MVLITIILNVLPSIILYLIYKFGQRWINDDISKVKDPNIKESIFYSFCISFIGFNLITSIMSLFIENTESTLTQTPIMYIYAVLFSPIFEELICRKLIQNKVSKYTNIKLSILISAIIFATLHFNIIGLPGYLFIGIVWGWYYHKTNNIFVPIMSHFLFNYITLLIQSLKG